MSRGGMLAFLTYLLTAIKTRRAAVAVVAGIRRRLNAVQIGLFAGPSVRVFPLYRRQICTGPDEYLARPEAGSWLVYAAATAGGGVTRSPLRSILPVS